MVSQANSNETNEQLVRLMEILQLEPDEKVCQSCLAQLTDYIETQLAHQDYLTHFPEVATHLDACLECAGAYARLYELALAEATSGLPYPAQIPAPDLRFLGLTANPVNQASLSLVEPLRSAFSLIGNRLRLQLSPELLAGWQPSLAFMATRASAETERYHEILFALEPDETLRSDLPLTITAYRDVDHPENCLVEVIVEQTGRSWPDLAGIPVVLHLAAEQQEALTDAWGLVSFSAVPVDQLANLVFEVTV